MGPYGTPWDHMPAKLCARLFPFLGWKIWIFGLSGVLWNFDFFKAFLGVRTGPSGFLDVLASCLPNKNDENDGLRVLSCPCIFGVWIFENISSFQACRGWISRAAVFRGCFCEPEVQLAPPSCPSSCVEALCGRALCGTGSLKGLSLIHI